MGKEIDFVRYRNDGDDFHVLWTARRALRMLDPNSGLVAIAIEGLSERERTTATRDEPGLLVIDTAEYYGSEDLARATQVIYYQLKYSTTAPDQPWTVAGLKTTLKAFAELFTDRCRCIGQAAVKSKIRFRFVSNRPISAPVKKAFTAAATGISVASLDPRAKTARKSLLKATGLTAVEFASFAAQVDLWGGLESREDLSRHLGAETGRYTSVLDSDASIRMKDLIRSKALSRSANDKTISRDTLLQQFGLANERELFPAEPKFEDLTNPIVRSQENNIVHTILATQWPVIIRAPGGVGKSVLAQRLGIHLPTGSEVVVFDGFAGGDYRNPRLYRHKHSHGLAQIANELARRGLCDVLIPQHAATGQQYLEAFRKRVEQAIVVVRARASDAIVLIVIDAADNLGMAADEAHDRSFVPDLLQEQPPEGCRLVALSRTHRVEKYLRPVRATVQIDLEPFDLAESAAHLRRKFPQSSDEEVGAFHRFTDRNPRVQANALAVVEDLPSLMRALGPTVKTVETLIAGQLEGALEKVVREQAASRTEIEPLLAALAALSPPVPIQILAKAAGMTEEAVRSFIADFANGRPIVITDGRIQFRDEPVETWFHENFMDTPDRAAYIAAVLTPLAVRDGYVAAVLPLLLHRAGRYDELMKLALTGAALDTDDPVEQREVLLQRVQYALKAALSQNKLDDVAKLLLRAGEEVAADSRQSVFLMDHADLVSYLAGPGVVTDFIFRRRAWDLSEKGYIYCAAMLCAERRNNLEAEQFLSLSLLWLNDWFAKQQARPDDESPADRVMIDAEDIAAYAETIRTLRGSKAMVRFMSNWRDWAAFDATRIVVRRLIDRGATNVAEELLAVAGKRLSVKLATILEMSAVCAVPPAKYVRSTFNLLTSETTSPIDLKDYPEDTEILLAVVATAEIAMRSGLSAGKILALLNRYSLPNDRVYQSFDRGARRETVLRAGALKAALLRRPPTLDDVMPNSVGEAKEKPGAEHNREVLEFKEVYGALLPWYSLRTFALAGRVNNWVSAVETAKKECQTNRVGWGARMELGVVVNEIGGIWFEAAIWADHENGSSATEIDKWLADQRVVITIPTWTNLVRLAAHHHASCRDSALVFAQRARELIEGEYGDAREKAGDFAALARAILLLGAGEASSYFQKALEHLSKLGDELYERLFSILTIARTAANDRQPNPREAYRVARMGELFHAYNDHKFPWSDVTEAVTKLCPASGFAVVSRWNDRARVYIGRTLPSVVLNLLEAKILRPTVATALHALGGYWELHKRIPLFLDGQLEPARKQVVLDTLALDHEFDPDNDESAENSLLDAARAHGLVQSRLQALVDFRKRMPDSDSSRTWHPVNENQDNPRSPEWQELLKGIDLHTPEGVDEACRKRQATRMPSDPNSFLGGMRNKVDPARRPEHAFALARSQELMASLALDGLEACVKDWGASLAVTKAAGQAAKNMLGERAQELINRGWALDDTLRRCAVLTGLTAQEVSYKLMRGLADHVETLSAGTLFNLAGALAKSALSQEQAKDALAFGLDRLASLLRDEDSDGPWKENLAPPEVTRAVACFLYALLASPEAAIRWRAAHAVRRLCRFGETQLVAELVSLLPSEELQAFTDSDLPFYAMHARLFLLIALARAADEAPETLVPHVQEFVQWALEKTPHTLIRHFAAHAALSLERSRSGLLDQKTISRLTSVNASKFPPQQRQPQSSTAKNDQMAERTHRFTFDYDFDRYWLDPLGDAFNLRAEQVAERAESWIVDRWHKSDLSAWNKDPRARRNIYRGRETHASHGSYPSIDRLSFYLSYHAMFCVAGELLAVAPPSLEYGRNGWHNWLSRHLLTRSDGKWLADRRDVEPLGARRWQLENERWEQRNEWRYSVLAEDFDQALGLDSVSVQELPVWGSWHIKGGNRKETISVSSALVTPSTSFALLRALQTASNPLDYKIPEEQDDLEIDLPGFQLRGWISDPYADIRLDEFDPFAGKIPWPSPAPGRRIRRLFKLVGESEGRVWRSNVPVITARIWGNRSDDSYRSAGNHGERLDANLDFLLDMLRRLDRHLIIEVEIEHDHGIQEKDEIDFIHRRYTRIYLLREDGKIHTLYGNRILRPAAGERTAT